MLAIHRNCHPNNTEAIRAAILNALSESNIDQMGRLERYEVEQLMRYAQRTDREMALASLRVIMEQGAEADLPALKTLATGVRMETIDQEVRAKARECIEAIERRIALQPKELELLRSSDKLEEPATLLRASHSADAPSEKTVLLRSSQEDVA